MKSCTAGQLSGSRQCGERVHSKNVTCFTVVRPSPTRRGPRSFWKAPPTASAACSMTCARRRLGSVRCRGCRRPCVEEIQEECRDVEAAWRKIRLSHNECPQKGLSNRHEADSVSDEERPSSCTCEYTRGDPPEANHPSYPSQHPRDGEARARDSPSAAFGYSQVQEENGDQREREDNEADLDDVPHREYLLVDIGAGLSAPKDADYCREARERGCDLGDGGQ